MLYLSELSLIIQLSSLFSDLFILSVAACDEHRLSLNVQSKQFITVNVISTHAQFKSFGMTDSVVVVMYQSYSPPPFL